MRGVSSELKNIKGSVERVNLTAHVIAKSKKKQFLQIKILLNAMRFFKEKQLYAKKTDTIHARQKTAVELRDS